jgi:hypothetical protein
MKERVKEILGIYFQSCRAHFLGFCELEENTGKDM